HDRRVQHGHRRAGTDPERLHRQPHHEGRAHHQGPRTKLRRRLRPDQPAARHQPAGSPAGGPVNRRRWLLLAAPALLLAGGVDRLLANPTPPSEPARLPAPSLIPGEPVAGSRGDAVDARAPRTAELTPQQVWSIDPESEPQRWVEAVDAFRARLERFAIDPTSAHARRREEGEELLRLVDAFATKNFYLPGQQSPVKLEIARQIYGEDPELMAELTLEYETDALNEATRFREAQAA